MSFSSSSHCHHHCSTRDTQMELLLQQQQPPPYGKFSICSFSKFHVLSIYAKNTLQSVLFLFLLLSLLLLLLLMWLSNASCTANSYANFYSASFGAMHAWHFVHNLHTTFSIIWCWWCVKKITKYGRAVDKFWMHMSLLIWGCFFLLLLFYHWMNKSLFAKFYRLSIILW